MGGIKIKCVYNTVVELCVNAVAKDRLFTLNPLIASLYNRFDCLHQVNCPLRLGESISVIPPDLILHLLPILCHTQEQTQQATHKLVIAAIMASTPALMVPPDLYFSPHSTNLPFGTSIGHPQASSPCLSSITMHRIRSCAKSGLKTRPFGSTLTNTLTIKGIPTSSSPRSHLLDQANLNNSTPT